MLNRYSLSNTVRRLCVYLVVVLWPAMLPAQSGPLANAQPVRTGARPLPEVLDEIRHYFKVSFVYEPAVVEGKETIETLSTRGKVEQVLTHVLDPLGLRFKKINNSTYSIVPKAPPRPLRNTRRAQAMAGEGADAFFTAPEVEGVAYRFVSSMPDITVKGIITDENNSPIPGANILLKGTTTGVTTDINGAFSITVPDENAVLVVSFIGYASQEITVGTQTNLSVQLKPDVQQLSEVVVVGYGTQRRSSVTGAVASINSREVAALPVPGVDAAIQGRVPGVQVTNNGSPGTTPPCAYAA